MVVHRLVAYFRSQRGIRLLTAIFMLTLSALSASVGHAQVELDALTKSDFLLPSGQAGYPSPTIADIDGDPSNGLEIVVASSDGYVHTFLADGSELWSKALPNASCSGLSSTNKVFSSPSVGALRGTGVPNVVIGYGGFGRSSCDTGVIALRGSDGATTWKFSTKAFATKQRFFSLTGTVFSTPTLADTDGDGKLEIAFGSFDRNIYQLDWNGSVRYYINAADTIWSSATFANIDRDPALEMIIGSDVSVNEEINPPTPNGGYVNALDTIKPASLLIPFRDPFNRVTKWRYTSDQVMYSSPVVAELIPEKRGKEVVIGTGCFFPEGTTDKEGSSFKVLSGRRGKLIRSLETGQCSPSAPATADLDGDGLLEVIVSTPGEASWGGDGQGTVIAFNPRTGTQLWSQRTSAIHPFQSPIVADLNLDGTREVVMGTANSILAFDAATGTQVMRLTFSGSQQSTPVISDLNGDGLLDLVAVAGGKVVVWTDFAEEGQEAPTPLVAIDETSVPWSQWRGASDRNPTPQ